MKSPLALAFAVTESNARPQGNQSRRSLDVAKRTRKPQMFKSLAGESVFRLAIEFVTNAIVENESTTFAVTAEKRSLLIECSTAKVSPSKVSTNS
jgi:hypothetical protein